MSSYEYNQLLKFLYFEGYADSYEEAEYILEDMSDEEFEELLENQSWQNVRRAASTSRTNTTPIRLTGSNTALRPGDFSPKDPEKTKRRKKRGRKLEYEVRENFEEVVEYLFVEGYTDTIESAELMAESISAEWVNEILDEAHLIIEKPYQIYGPDPHGSSDSEPRPIGQPYKNRKRAKTRANELDQQIGGYRHSVHKVDEKYVKALDTTGRGADHRAVRSDSSVRPRRLRPMNPGTKYWEADFDSEASRRSPSARRRKTQRRQGTGGFDV